MCSSACVCVCWRLCAGLCVFLNLVDMCLHVHFLCAFLAHIRCFVLVRVLIRSCVLIIYHQLQLAGSSSHSSWCMLIEQPQAKTGDLIYKLIRLVLWGIDLPVSPSVKHSPGLYSEWQQVIKVWLWERTMKVFTIILFSAIAFSDIHILRRIPDMSKSWNCFCTQKTQ